MGVVVRDDGSRWAIVPATELAGEDANGWGGVLLAEEMRTGRAGWSVWWAMDVVRGLDLADGRWLLLSPSTEMDEGKGAGVIVDLGSAGRRWIGGDGSARGRGSRICYGRRRGAAVRGLLEMSAAEADGAAGASWAVSCSRVWTLTAAVGDGAGGGRGNGGLLADWRRRTKGRGFWTMEMPGLAVEHGTDLRAGATTGVDVVKDMLLHSKALMTTYFMTK
ncbi:hypothetical protein ACLOJK_012365 [Asimina triloba]